MNFSLKSTTAMGALLTSLLAMPAWAHMDAAMEFLDNEINGLSVLNRAEQEAEMRRHPQLGYRVLAEVGRLDEVAMPIILEHHERLDGTGYPAGLEGDEIHIYARICAIVDVFDALTTTRPYRKGMKTFEALRLMRETMASELQPEFLAEFVKIFAH